MSAERAPEEVATRRKRLHMRAWWRGTKEMDLILGPFADARLAAMDAAALSAFEAVLEENDQDLYRWITDQGAAPSALRPLLAEIAVHARTRLAPGG